MKSKISKVTLLIIIFALVLTTTLVPMSAFAATTATGYDSADDVQYVKNGKYIYNWGARGEIATFLSPNAEKFYTGSYTFANLAKVSGGTSQSTAPSSALYSQLKTLMTNKQTYVTSYDATRSLFQYTDCQLSGKETKKISSFYSGDLIGPDWDSGNTWNREHTWPNSKGDSSGQGENDIMMLRPTATSENGSRGNKAYGKTSSSSFYNPNSESGGKYDLRGDVARICLFVYTRWGNTGSMWGASGVMESLAVLLEWMEEDPVDTWEMGRNDAVESITGTRNVFVDYPEYAFLLFGQNVPDNYPTPSQSNGVVAPKPEDCQHSFKDATCTEPKTCTLCWTTEGSALNHTTPDANGLCTRCGEVLEVKTTHAGTKDDPYTVADALKVGNNLDGSNSSSKVYVQGQVDSIAKNNGSYLEGIVITDSSGKTLSIYSADPQNKTVDMNVKVGDTILLYGYIRISNSTGTPEMGTINGEFVKFSIVTSNQEHTCESKCSTCGDCTDKSCTENACSTKCQGHQSIPPVTSGTTIDLTTPANKVSASSQKLEFANGELKVTVDKASSTVDLIDKTGDGYAARVYAGATLTVEYPQMTKIVINCDGNTYNNKTYISGFDGMTVAGATITREGNVITITFDSAVDKFVSASMASQTRILSIEVFTTAGGTGGSGQEHTHVYADATCTNPKTCSCGDTQGQALGHTEVVDPAVDSTCTATGLTEGKHCTVCNQVTVAQQTVPATGHTKQTIPAVAPSCTETGLTEGEKCSVCGEITLEQEEVESLGHTQANAQGNCDRCGVPDATVEAFKLAVTNVQSATTMDAKFTALSQAVEVYNTMNATQKAQVSSEFATLKAEVENYNTQAITQNTNSNNALQWAIQIASITAVAVALLVTSKKVF